MSEEYSARVDENGNVYAIEPNGERLVGQYADVSPEEAIAFFTKKFNDTNASLVLIEQRVKNNTGGKDLSESLNKIIAAVEAKAGLGNYSALSARIDALKSKIDVLLEQESAHKAELLEAAKLKRQEIVASIEKLAARDPQKIQWKSATAEIESLFSQWQELQKTGPRIPKSEADDLWKRFRTARQTLDKERRAYFSELDSRTKEAKATKEKLISQAEALAPKGAEGIAQYRSLLEQWKKAPRAGKKVEDTLWFKFKSAGDVLYEAKKSQDAAEDESYAENLDTKLAILSEAEALLENDNAADARQKLSLIVKRWEKAGKVPRAHVKSTEERMKKVETHVRKLEEKEWASTDPEKQARQDGLAEQIRHKIQELESELSSTSDENKKKELENALSTQKEWLKVLN